MHAKSAQLLERLANSIYDRDRANPYTLCFTSNEMHIVETWIDELIEEIKKASSI